MSILKEVPMIVDWPATWSKILMFITCRWKFWLHEGSKFITGAADIPFATNVAMQRGEAKHDLYERAARIMLESTLLPKSISENPLWNGYIGGIIRKLLWVYPHTSTEEKIGVDSTWQSWSLGEYWSPDKVAFGNRKMLLRTKMDLVLFNAATDPTHAVIVDYKSGKPRKAEGLGQLALYALAAFCKWPTLQQINCVYIFVDHNIRDEQVYLKQSLPDLKTHFTNQILEIQQYLKNASLKIPAGDCTPGNCHWCAATKEQCNEKT